MELSILKIICNWRKIAYVTQTMFLLRCYFLENIAFGVSHDNINFKLIEKVIHQSNLKTFLKILQMILDIM